MLAIAAILFFVNPLLNRGHVFYTQTRMGRDGQPFRIVKFRTMLPASKDATIAFASAEKDRITRLGALLRKFRIDELPQIVNVLIGNMSFVGPRPEQVAFVQTFNQHDTRLSLPPRRAPRHQRARASAERLCRLRRVHAPETGARPRTYPRRAGWAMETKVVMRTLYVVVTGYGAQ